MKLEITDYPRVDPMELPSKLQGKFVQLVLRDREHLIFAPFELHGYHNQILARFLDEQGIAHRWRNPEILDVETSTLRVIGGGRYEVDVVAKTLCLWDNSQVYGRFDPRGLCDRIARADHEWSGYAISISE